MRQLRRRRAIASEVPARMIEVVASWRGDDGVGSSPMADESNGIQDVGAAVIAGGTTALSALATGTNTTHAIAAGSFAAFATVAVARWKERSARMQLWFFSHIFGQAGDDAQSLLERMEKDANEPYLRDTLRAALRALDEADDAVVPAMAAIAFRCLREKTRPDILDRGMLRVLAELDSGMYVSLRGLVLMLAERAEKVTPIWIQVAPPRPDAVLLCPTLEPEDEPYNHSDPVENLPGAYDLLDTLRRNGVLQSSTDGASCRFNGAEFHSMYRADRVSLARVRAMVE